MLWGLPRTSRPLAHACNHYIAEHAAAQRRAGGRGVYPGNAASRLRDIDEMIVTYRRECVYMHVSRYLAQFGPESYFVNIPSSMLDEKGAKIAREHLGVLLHPCSSASFATWAHD